MATQNNSMSSRNMTQEADMKGSKKMEWETVGENSTTRMEGTIKDSGKEIKWMGGEDCIIRVEK